MTMMTVVVVVVVIAVRGISHTSKVLPSEN